MPKKKPSLGQFIEDLAESDLSLAEKYGITVEQVQTYRAIIAQAQRPKPERRS